jgi:hypothetical protein
MKLRIKGNSIRLRLGQSEVQRMLDQGIVEESTIFDNCARQRLDYVLCTGPNLLAVTASFEDGRIVVRMPNALMRQWAETEQVGVESIQVGSDGGALRILVEKDFECVDATDESQEDAFPHPQVTGACLSAEVIERSTHEHNYS